MKLSIVVPAYNEEGSIKGTIERIRETNPTADLLVINDRSTDKTLKILKELNVQTITHKANKGYGAALKTGFRNVKTEYIAFLDADLTYDPEYIPMLLNVAMEENLDCVWGNRFGGKRNKMSGIRKIGNKIISWVFFVTTLKKVNDCTSGERVLRSDILKKLDFETLSDDLDFITALTKRIVSRDLKFKEIPMNYSTRGGASKLNIFEHGYKMLRNVLLEK